MNRACCPAPLFDQRVAIAKIDYRKHVVVHFHPHHVVFVTKPLRCVAALLPLTVQVVRVASKLFGNFVASASCSRVKSSSWLASAPLEAAAAACSCNCSMNFRVNAIWLPFSALIDTHSPRVFELRSCAAARSSSRPVNICFRMPTVSSDSMLDWLAIADCSLAVATFPAYDFPGWIFC